MTAPADLAALDRKKYVRLTTFRRDGTAVHTPVWFAVDGDTLLVWTDAASGKAKRIRNNPGVELAPCDGRGRTDAVPVTAQAVVLPPDQHGRAHDLLNRKYGLTKRAIQLGYEVNRLVRRQPKGEDTVIAITLAPPAE